MTLKVTPEWRTRCSDCGQLTYRSSPPAEGEECERCVHLRTVGLIPTATVGLRVRIASIHHPVDPSAQGYPWDDALVFIGKQNRAVPCPVQDLGLWTPTGVTPDYIGHDTDGR